MNATIVNIAGWGLSLIHCFEIWNGRKIDLATTYHPATESINQTNTSTT
jgi:hypothetical protein